MVVSLTMHVSPYAILSGFKTPPIYRSQTNMIASHNFPGTSLSSILSSAVNSSTNSTQISVHVTELKFLVARQQTESKHGHRNVEWGDFFCVGVSPPGPMRQFH